MMDAAELVTANMSNTEEAASTCSHVSLYEPHDSNDVMDIPPRSPSRLGVRHSPQSRKETAASKIPLQRPQMLRRSAELGRSRHSYSAYDSDAEDSLFSASDSGDEDDLDSDTSDSSAEDDFIYDAPFMPKSIQISATPAPESDNPSPSPPPSSPPPPIYHPSPLSDRHAHTHDRFSSAPRHDYAHHGLSRSSLHYQKWFWHIRQEEWQEWEAQVEEAHAAATAYDGIAVPPKPPPRGPPRDRPQYPEIPATYNRFIVADPNAPIYPRVGNLSDLRHGQSVHLDRWFCFFPLYKVQKKLFLHAVVSRASSAYIQESPPGSEDDVTLVADTSSEPAIDEDESLDDLISADLGEQRKPRAKVYLPSWENNWVLRWEKFAEILRDEAMTRVPTTPPLATPEDEPLQPVSSKFYFEEADEDSDGTDSDEDDYGVLMSNPIFKRPMGFGFHSFSTFDARREVTLICA